MANGFRTPAIRIDDFEVPPMECTEQALIFGATLTPDQRRTLTIASQAMAAASAFATNLNEAIRMATVSQLWREAAQHRAPALAPDRGGKIRQAFGQS